MAVQEPQSLPARCQRKFTTCALQLVSVLLGSGKSQLFSTSKGDADLVAGCRLDVSIVALVARGGMVMLVLNIHIPESKNPLDFTAN